MTYSVEQQATLRHQQAIYDRWLDSKMGDVLWDLARFAQEHPDADIETDATEALRRLLAEWKRLEGA